MRAPSPMATPITNPDNCPTCQKQPHFLYILKKCIHITKYLYKYVLQYRYMYVCGAIKIMKMFFFGTDWVSFIKDATMKRMMKVAMSSTQKASPHPRSGLVMKSSGFIPYTDFATYVANTEPPTCASTYNGTLINKTKKLCNCCRYSGYIQYFFEKQHEQLQLSMLKQSKNFKYLGPWKWTRNCRS